MLNVTVQSQMFYVEISVLNVNFGRELLPQGITTLHWKTEAMRFVDKYFFRS